MTQPVQVPDGIVDPETWLVAPRRVLWLLREVNNPKRDWTDLLGALRTWSVKMERNGRPTWVPVAKVTYGLLHPAQPWSSFCRRPDLYLPSLRSIAVVNVKKTGGGAASKWKELEKAYDVNKDGLRQQIREAKPHVVIGGNVLWLLRHELGGWAAPDLPKLRGPAGSYESISHGGRIWVHAHHPAHRGKHEAYYRRIRAAVEAHRDL